MRAALDDLVREGYLVRRRGAGTFVSEPKIAQELTMTSFTEDMRRRGMRAGEPHARAAASSPAGARLGRVLHVSPSEPVVVAKRLRLADRETMAIETLHVRESLVPGLTARDLERAFVLRAPPRPLRDRDRRRHADDRADRDDEEESEALGVPLHSPAFLFERMTRSQTGEIVEYVRSIYRGDRYRLVTELDRAARRAQRRPGARGPRRIRPSSWY